MTLAERITVDPAVMGGRPCVRGLRVSVGTVADRDPAVRRLHGGALVTVSPGESRIRILPLQRE